MYLGHVIDECGVHPCEEKVKEAPKPKKVTEMMSFLGGGGHHNLLWSFCQTVHTASSLQVSCTARGTLLKNAISSFKLTLTKGHLVCNNEKFKLPETSMQPQPLAFFSNGHQEDDYRLQVESLHH